MTGWSGLCPPGGLGIISSEKQWTTESKRLRMTVTDTEVTSFLNIGSELADQLQAMYGVDNLAQLDQLQLEQALQNVEGLPQWVGLLERARGTLGLQLPSGRLRVTIQEPEVRFHPNRHIVIRGYAAAPGVRQPLRLVMAPRASARELVFDFGGHPGTGIRA